MSACALATLLLVLGSTAEFSGIVLISTDVLAEAARRRRRTGRHISLNVADEIDLASEVSVDVRVSGEDDPTSRPATRADVRAVQSDLAELQRRIEKISARVDEESQLREAAQRPERFEQLFRAAIAPEYRKRAIGVGLLLLGVVLLLSANLLALLAA